MDAIKIYADRQTKITYDFFVDEILPVIEEALANGAPETEDNPEGEKPK